MLNSVNYIFIKSVINNNGDCYTARDGVEWFCKDCPIGKKLNGKSCMLYHARQAAVELLNEEVSRIIEE